MSTTQDAPIDEARRRELEHKLRELVVRYGAQNTPDLEAKTERCVTQIVEALCATSTDQKSLSPLDVVRIRAGKFAATLTPPALFRDARQLAALRAEIHEMARAFVGDSGAQGSRFLPDQRK